MKGSDPMRGKQTGGPGGKPGGRRLERRHHNANANKGSRYQSMLSICVPTVYVPTYVKSCSKSLCNRLRDKSHSTAIL